MEGKNKSVKSSFWILQNHKEEYLSNLFSIFLSVKTKSVKLNSSESNASYFTRIPSHLLEKLYLCQVPELQEQFNPNWTLQSIPAS